MKPLHIGLLAVGATLAGGLAFEMTQPPTIPIAAAPAPQAAVSPVAVATVPRAAPVAIAARQVKPSPIPKPAPPPVAEAPAPVYTQEPKPATRRSKPVLLAKASVPKEAPTQWAPLPYQIPVTPKPVSPPPPTPRHVTLPTGMTVAVRLADPLSADRATAGDMFEAVLAEPLVVGDLVIAERGARATGNIVESQRGARLGNPSILELELTSVNTSDGQRVPLATDPWLTQGIRQAERADDPIGAIFSRPKPASVATASVIRFRLSSRVTVTEQLASR